jgi:hypothetical protein
MNIKRFGVAISVLLIFLALGMVVMLLKSKGFDVQNSLQAPTTNEFIFIISGQKLGITESSDNIDKLIKEVSSGQDNTLKLEVNFTDIVPAQTDIYIYNSQYPLGSSGEAPVPGISKQVPVALLGCTKPASVNGNVRFDFFVSLDELKSLLTQDETNLIANNLMKRCITYALREHDFSEEELANLSNDIYNNFQGKDVITINY